MQLTYSFSLLWGAYRYTAKKIAEQELSIDKGDKIIITGDDTSGTSGNTSLIKIENF